MKLRNIEARVLIYLSQVDNLRKEVKSINKVIKVDYQYLCRILREMNEKGYLARANRNNVRKGVVYDILQKGKDKLEEAREILK